MKWQPAQLELLRIAACSARCPSRRRPSRRPRCARRPSSPAAPRRAPPGTPRAESACGFPASRHIRRCAGSTAATGTGAAGSRAPNAARSRRSRAHGCGARRPTKPSSTRCMPACVERERHALAARMRQRRRRHGLPAAVARRDVGAAFPRHRAGRLAAGVRQLDRQLDRRMAADRLDHRRQRGRMVVRPQARGRWPRCALPA